MEDESRDFGRFRVFDVFIFSRFDAPPRKSCIVRDQSLCIFDDDLKLLGWMKYGPDAVLGLGWRAMHRGRKMSQRIPSLGSRETAGCASSTSLSLAYARGGTCSLACLVSPDDEEQFKSERIGLRECTRQRIISPPPLKFSRSYALSPLVESRGLALLLYIAFRPEEC